MKRFLALAVLTMATALGTADTAEAQFGRGFGGGRGYTISIGNRGGLGLSYGRSYGNFNRGFGGSGFNRGGFYGRPVYQRPVYYARPVYRGGYYGGRSFYGGRRW